MRELADIPFIAAPTGTSTRRLLDEAFDRAGVTPRIAVVTAQRDAILPLVLAGAGAALVPESLAQGAARSVQRLRDPARRSPGMSCSPAGGPGPGGPAFPGARHRGPPRI